MVKEETQCYSLLWKKMTSSPFAVAQSKGWQPDYQLINTLEKRTSMPHTFTIVKVLETPHGMDIRKGDALVGVEGVWLDSLLNSHTWPMFSEKFKKMIDDHVTGKEHLDWVHCEVSAQKKTRPYYIPRFGKPFDILDKELSTYEKPYFMASKIRDYAIFNDYVDSAEGEMLYKITPIVYVTQYLARAIYQAEITGVLLEKELVC